MSKQTTTSGGIGFCSILFLIFLTLKLTEVGQVAKWSWIWVFAPLWIPAAITLAIFLISLIFIFLGYIVKIIASWFTRRSNLRKMMDE